MVHIYHNDYIRQAIKKFFQTTEKTLLFKSFANSYVTENLLIGLNLSLHLLNPATLYRTPRHKPVGISPWQIRASGPPIGNL